MLVLPDEIRNRALPSVTVRALRRTDARSVSVPVHEPLRPDGHLTRTDTLALRESRWLLTDTDGLAAAAV